jgi:hypothetical protein
MNVGTIISFEADKQTHYGQIIVREEGLLTVKILFSDISVDIMRWKKAWQDGMITIPFGAEKSYIDFQKTVVVTWDRRDFLPRWKRFLYRLLYVKCSLLLYEDGSIVDEQGNPKLLIGWRLKHKMRGVLFADGTFAPIRFGQIRLNDIYYFDQYNKLKPWQQTTNRPFSMSYGRIRPGSPT